MKTDARKISRMSQETRLNLSVNVNQSVNLEYENIQVNGTTTKTLNDLMKKAQHLRALTDESEEILREMHNSLEQLQGILKISLDEQKNITLTSCLRMKRMVEEDAIPSEMPRVCEEDDSMEYIVFTWVLCLIALAAALKLYYLVKLLLALVMVSVYSTFIIIVYGLFEKTTGTS